MRTIQEGNEVVISIAGGAKSILPLKQARFHSRQNAVAGNTFGDLNQRAHFGREVRALTWFRRRNHMYPFKCDRDICGAVYSIYKRMYIGVQFSHSLEQFSRDFIRPR